MNINPLQLIQSMKNPQQFIMNMLGNNVQNPMLQNLMTMAKEGKTQEVENFARNICKEKGMDFDKNFADFMSTIKK